MKNSPINKLTATLIFCFLLGSFLPATLQAQTWYNAGWLYRKAITIDYNKVGAGPHTNFPVLISHTDADLATKALTNGNDILFTASDGITKLNHEIETYTTGTGTLSAWVQVPTLVSTANTVIYMYYGNAAAGNQQNIAPTWDATFSGVYHLNNSILDAKNTYNATYSGTTSNVTGKISNGRGFTGIASDSLMIPGQMGSPANITVSAWAYAKGSVGKLISLGDNVAIRMSTGSTNSFYRYASGGNWDGCKADSNLFNGWHYVAFTINNGVSQVQYIDGAAAGSISNNKSIVYGGGANTWLGRNGNSVNNILFTGTIDEARVSNVSRSAGWILTEYNNQNAPASFYSTGPSSCNTAIAAPIVTTPVMYCRNAIAVPLTATGTNLLWNTGATPTPVTTAPGTTIYTVTQSAGGCVSTAASIAVIVNDLPTTANAGPNQTGASTCGLTSVTLAANTPTVGTGVWSITAGAGGNVTNLSSPTSTFTGTAGTAYILSWTISNSPCTASTSSVLITFNQMPVVSGTSTGICVGSGGTASITAAGTGPLDPLPYSINNGAYQASPLFSGVAAGTYTINVKGSTGCVGSNTVVVGDYTTSTDDQTMAGADSWIGHVYDGMNFNNYIGHYTEPLNFDEGFGGNSNCFVVTSNAIPRSIYTDTFSVRYLMNSTLKGLYVADLGSDDGSQLTVDNSMVFANWYDQSFNTKPSILMNLTGASKLIYEFYEKAGGNRVIFNNLRLVLANTLSANITQNICKGTSGAVISGDVAATISGITTTYQWSYSTTAGGTKIDIAGATGATYAPLATDAVFSTAGTYYIYRTATASSTNNISSIFTNPYVTSCVSNAATIIITPSAVLAGVTKVCVGSTVTLSFTTGGTWSSNNTLLATVTPSGVVTGVASGSPKFTFTPGAVGCSSTNTSLTVNALPVATLSAPSVCVGSTITLSTAAVVTWINNGTAATVTPAGIVTIVSAGTATFTGNNTTTGCSNTTPVLTVNPIPVVKAAASVCVGSSFTLSPGTGGTWNSSNPAFATVVSNTGVVTGIAAGSPTFTYTNTSTGCSNTTTAVTVNALPVVTAAAAVCVGSTITLSPATGGNWSSNNLGVASVIATTGVVTGAAAGTVTFNYTASTGCVNTTTALTVNLVPTVSNPPAKICAGTSINLTPATGGTWASSTPLFASVANDGTVTGLTAGTATFTFTSTAGCSKATSALTVVAAPVLTAATAVCVGGTISLLPAGGTWVSNNGTAASVTNAGVVTGIATGLATFTYTLSSTGCSSTTPTVTVNPLPTLEAIGGGAASVCAGKATPAFTNSTSGGSWSVANVTGTASISTGGVVTGLTSGTVTISYTYSNGNCSNKVSQAVTVNPLPAVAAIAGGATTGCAGNTTPAFTDATAGGTWSVTNVTGTASITAGGVLTGLTAGTVTIVYTVSNGTCSNSATKTLTINASPKISIVADYCTSPGKIVLKATSDVSVTGWTWNNGVISTGTSSTTDTALIDIAGNYTITASNSAGCPTTASIIIAQELVINGDFTNGNTGFSSDYKYWPDIAGNNELVYDGENNGYSISNNGLNVHTGFYGQDHTNNQTGTRNFLLVNGHDNLKVWTETVNVLPNTTYYFSAWGMSLNAGSPSARLQFSVNSATVGSVGVLAAGVNDNTNNGWVRFWGQWSSGTSTTAKITIVDLETSHTNNDFGVDDISFATLAPFSSLTSGTGTDQQINICATTPIVDITYAVGGDGNIPTVTGMPAGLTTSWDGRTIRFSGNPTIAGTYNYTLQSSGCNIIKFTGQIIVQAASVSGTLPAIISTCYNTPAVITLVGPVGNVSNWARSTDGGTTWADVASTSLVVTVPNLTSSVLYKAVVKNNNCTATSAVVKLGVRNLWTGEFGADWNNNKNWSDECLPTLTLCDDIRIPAVVSPKVYPVLSSGTTAAKNIIINANASLTVNGSGSLKIAGTINNNGVLDAVNGSLEFNGLSPQTIVGSTFKDNTIMNLTDSNKLGLTISSAGNPLKITGTLAFGNVSNATLNTGNNLTLVSTAIGTARLADITNKGTVNGNTVVGSVSIERYIPAKRAWHLLAAPLIKNTPQTINAAWQEGVTTASTNPNPNPGYGMQITGGSVANGFDIGVNFNPSVKTYSNSTNSFVSPVSTLATPIADTNSYGYMLFVRGNRGNLIQMGVNSPISNTTLRMKGGINFNKMTVPVFAKNYTLIGNPYPSAISFHTLKKNNVNDKFWLWDPQIAGSRGLGGYVTMLWNNTSNGYDAVPSTSPISRASGYVASGEAFFVASANQTGAGSIEFNETDKNSSTNDHVFRPVSGKEKMRVNLFGFETDATEFLTDGVLTTYNNDNANAVDNNDALKLYNLAENICIARDGKALSIERRHTIDGNDTTFFSIYGMQKQAYKMQVTAEAMGSSGLYARIKDNYPGGINNTPLNMDGVTDLIFTVNTDPASYAVNRFSIVFGKLAPLPVTFTAVNAYQRQKDIAVEWKTASETNVKEYTVETSATGVNFSKAAVVKATTNNGGSAAYSWLDVNAANGMHYYRIKSTDNSGEESYSTIVKVNITNGASGMAVYPNPVENDEVWLQLNNMAKGKYAIRLLNSIGQALVTREITHPGGSTMEKITVSKYFAKGIYTLEITCPDKTKTTIAVLNQ